MQDLRLLDASKRGNTAFRPWTDSVSSERCREAVRVGRQPPRLCLKEEGPPISVMREYKLDALDGVSQRASERTNCNPEGP